MLAYGESVVNKSVDNDVYVVEKYQEIRKLVSIFREKKSAQKTTRKGKKCRQYYYFMGRSRYDR
jgi:hypothetical protein